MSIYSPNPCLLGIILTISTHNGPQLVYHYPPKPHAHGYKSAPLNSTMSVSDTDAESSEITTGGGDIYEERDDNDDADNDEDDEDEDEELTDSDSDSGIESSSDEELSSSNVRPKTSYLGGQTLLDILDEQDHQKEVKRKRRELHLREKHSISSSTRRSKSNNTSENNSLSNFNTKLKWKIEKLFGFNIEFLCEFLNPPKQMCNARFELTVDDMIFLGLPIHTNDDGSWRRNRQKRYSKSRHSTTTSTTNTNKNDNELDEPLPEPSPLDAEDHETGTNAKEGEEACNMNMFHIVFVMNPPITEYSFIIEEMFHFVVSRLCLVLRYEQAKSNYVWNEASKILKIKEESEDLTLYELYAKLNEKSSLAKALEHCFNMISTSNIANLEINDKLISLQIPVKTQFESLPPRTTPVLSGSYLSTANSFKSTNGDQEEIDNNMGYMALLLLDEPEKIITDLKTEANNPLATFIRNIQPTISLNKLSTINKVEVNQLKSFANHLIYWRRARAIIPLQTKSVFIVSPIAPMDEIHENMRIFRNEFPSLPSLPSFLSLLSSSKPRQYSTIIPSKDHKDIYLDALAWLIRYGYATQLLTFFWLKISNRIKISVDEDLENEGITTRNKTKFTDISTDNTSKDQSTDGVGLRKNESFINASLSKVVIEKEEDEDTILLDPERATAVERRWISKCIKGQPPEIVAVFHKLLKYFNGTTPLELVLVKESISRHDLRRLLHSINDHIISVKHW